MSQTTTTTEKYLDFDLIVQELLRDVHSKRNQAFVKGYEPVGRLWTLRDLMTIGFFAPRQSGKSRWLAKQLLENPNHVAVFTNGNERKMFLSVAKQCFPEHPNLNHLKGQIMIGRRMLDTKNKRIPSFKVEKFDRLYVDGSTYLFEYIKRNSFYTWIILNNTVKYPEIILIN